MDAFHTLRVRRPENFALADFELFTLALSALEWRKHNGRIKLATDSVGAEYMHECGLSEVWNSTEILLDGMTSLDIHEDVFWAGAKIYALSQQVAPCVMIDLDFILWQTIEFARFGKDLAVIHRERVQPPVYPPKCFFGFVDGWQLPNWLDWSVLPCNGALVYFGSNRFLREYTGFSLDFMKHAATKSDRLSYMVFAEQRWMAMCAKKMGIPVHELSSVESLFDKKQKYFTHVWGYKQKLRENLDEADKFCRTCGDRLKHDFPEFAEKLKDYAWAANYMEE